MSRVLLVGIEPHGLRYTSDWTKWFSDALGELYDVAVIGPTTRWPSTVPPKGDARTFLDPLFTHEFKAVQVEALTAQIRGGFGRAPDDLIFWLDAWHPGVMHVAYMRDALGLTFKMAGIWHAGSYDRHDFLNRRGMREWALDFEAAVSMALDLNVFGTNYHHDMFMDAMRAKDMPQAVVHPYPVHVRRPPHMPDVDPAAPRLGSQRELRIVWPHRPAPEKQYAWFKQLKRDLDLSHPEWEVVSTAEQCSTRASYLETLITSEIIISTSLQENFGIAPIEGVQLGCVPLLPRGLCYGETLPRARTYAGYSDLLFNLGHLMGHLPEARGGEWSLSRDDAERFRGAHYSLVAKIYEVLG